jgi:hypothetical protein
MNVNELVEQYFGQIEIEDTNYVAVDDAVSDAAYILLILPTRMLRDYQKIKGSRKKLPDPVEFWKETGLCEKLRMHESTFNGGHANLSDVLDYLGGDVWGNYQKLSMKDNSRIRLDITEIPEFHPE